ncbi:tyrosine-type recombinase/integrase [Paenibacillus sp. LMG 31456]|uniref:Tyrosine-type recombinase/integrase n=1 Tax=Paenibacillus foliorum TaxID=2654974 RepID=A0A972GVD5_9BACL|nr:tyrosine-type recombinase/integrase [Paenibacillus foliorum]NOU94908.1 tyrosine-type recombinase/integrase [Paenibacillus foliorum]
MPIFDDAVTNEVALEETLSQLADQYGPDTFKRLLHSLLPSNNTESMKRYEELLLEDAVPHYFASDAFQSLANSSQQAYRYEMDLFLRYCRRLKGTNPSITEVSSAVFLTEYLAPVQKLNTRSKKSAFLRSFLGEIFSHFFNRDIGKLKRTLSIEIDRNREPRAFTKEQLDELLCHVRLGREAHRNFTILWTFLGSGIRLSELLYLQIRDIVSSRQEILVRGKGKKGYKQPSKITKSALDILNVYVNFRYHGVKNEQDYLERFIFSDDKGKSPLHESTIQKMFASLIDETSSIPKSDKKPYQLSVHSLRHSFALYLLESGVNLYTIKELMRHSWLSSTEVYLKLFDSMLVTAIDQHPLAQLKASDLF